MKLQDVFAAVNEMKAAGVIDHYAIGEAVGATSYLDPVSTLDVDVFVALEPGPGKVLASPKPIFDYLTALGATIEGEYLMVAGWPVQFLAPPGPLAEEALEQARQDLVEGEAVWVFTAEHLAAIALETGRPKDKARLLQFVSEAALDPVVFEAIIRRHGLTERWKKFELQFLGENA